MTNRKSKLSGRNVAEAERHTVAIKLRLPPEAAEELDELAAIRGLTRSALVVDLIRRETT